MEPHLVVISVRKSPQYKGNCFLESTVISFMWINLTWKGTSVVWSNLLRTRTLLVRFQINSQYPCIQFHTHTEFMCLEHKHVFTSVILKYCCSHKLNPCFLPTWLSTWVAVAHSTFGPLLYRCSVLARLASAWSSFCMFSLRSGLLGDRALAAS